MVYLESKMVEIAKISKIYKDDQPNKYDLDLKAAVSLGYPITYSSRLNWACSNPRIYDSILNSEYKAWAPETNEFGQWV